VERWQTSFENNWFCLLWVLMLLEQENKVVIAKKSNGPDASTLAVHIFGHFLRFLLRGNNFNLIVRSTKYSK